MTLAVWMGRREVVHLDGEQLISVPVVQETLRNNSSGESEISQHTACRLSR